MFDQPQSKQPAPRPATGGEPEDIFAGVETAAAPAKPVSPTTPLAVQQPTMRVAPQPVMPSSSAPQPTSSGSMRKVLVPALIVIGGAGIVAAGWFGYTALRDAMPANEPTVVADDASNEPVANTNAAVNDSMVNNTNDTTPTPPPPTNTAPTVYTPPADTDLDGLSDDEERVWGTDPTKADSDDDGLSDREETLTFGSDPRNPDSDGDTFTDGKEVEGGYNPVGEGKLLPQVPTTYDEGN